MSAQGAPAGAPDGLRTGELFAGYNGLGQAVEQVFNATPAWFSEVEAAPSRILAHHYPQVRNLGDITKIDFRAVEPVHILSGGFPCQDVSHAGLRRGLAAGTRTGLWSYFADAIEILQPAFVVAENVRGLLSAKATITSDVEPCEGCMGNGSKPKLRALGAVLGDLAERGYDAQWTGIRASDVGAPHQRFRVVLLAVRRDLAQNPFIQSGLERGFAAPRQAEGGRPRSLAAGRGGAPADAGPCPHCGGTGRAVPDPGSFGGLQGYADPERRGKGADRSGLVVERGADHPAADGGGFVNLPTPTTRDWKDSGDFTPRPEKHKLPHSIKGDLVWPVAQSGADVVWGKYEPAVRRWEAIFGPAPRPTEPTGRFGQERLSPAFVEWLMGQRRGWVTDPAIGLTWQDQLKALGNGVHTLQAVTALHHLLEIAARN